MENNNQQNISDFLNTEYRDYARHTVEERAIPAFADGLKPSQRKALEAGRRFADGKALKVSALSGKVMGDLGYVHGDSSMYSTIINMARAYRQGMPYFDSIGQFGTLYDPAAGAPRYISVKLSGWSKLVLADEAELKWNFDEDNNERVEPQYYLPILPMLLINGTDGIAVGFATSFANRNPLEVALACKEYLSTGQLPDYKLCPYVNGHTGVWSYWNGQFESCGPWHRKNTTVLSIDGLPFGTTLVKYRGYLNQLIEQGLIKRFDDFSSKGKTAFDIHMTEAALNQLIAENGVASMFRLINRLPTDNLTCIMPNKAIKRFGSTTEVIKEFIDWRFKFYIKRKKRIIADIYRRIAYLNDLIRFIDLVNDGTINFKGRTKHDLEQQLTELNIDRAVLNVQVYNLTDDNRKKHVAELEKLNRDLQNVQNTSERNMYIADIDTLIGHLRKFYVIEPVLNIKQELLLRPEESAA